MRDAKHKTCLLVTGDRLNDPAGVIPATTRALVTTVWLVVASGQADAQSFVSTSPDVTVELDLLGC